VIFGQNCRRNTHLHRARHAMSSKTMTAISQMGLAVAAHVVVAASSQ
jgi:hypothetical protein